MKGIVKNGDFYKNYTANLSTKSMIYQFAVAMATGMFSKKKNVKFPQHFLKVS